jgi:acyl-CoA thioesterase II
MNSERATTPTALVAQLIDLLDLRSDHEQDVYIGHRQPGGVGRVFGGEIIAQALMAATATVEPDRAVHSLHAYFIRGGSEDHPTEYRIARDFDGRSFSTRRVTAVQQGEIILNFAASFQRHEDGLEHQDPMPDVPPPETLKSEVELRADYIHLIPEAMRERFDRPRGIEFRPVTPRNLMNAGPQPAFQQSWFKLVSPIADDPLLHRGMLAYISDMQLLGTSILPHGLSWVRGEISSASLDHSIWFHDDFKVDDWLLFTATSPISKGGRGLNLGQIHSRDGRLVASLAQEGLVRRRRR